jgi:hypothetical protein
MSKKHALVMLWTGNSISDETIKQVATTLVQSKVTIPELLTCVYKDEVGIADSIVNIPVSGFKEEAVKQSVIYIGKRFNNALTNTNGDLSTFAAQLSNACTIDKLNSQWNNCSDESELLKAVEIISTTDSIIPQTLARQYHFSQRVVSIIKQVYANVSR